MSAPTAKPTGRPVAGAAFHVAARIHPGGEKRRRVLALAAAYRDGGLEGVTVGQLAAHLGWPWQRVHALLERLVADGYMVQSRPRKGKPRYRVVLPEERTP